MVSTSWYKISFMWWLWNIIRQRVVMAIILSKQLSILLVLSKAYIFRICHSLFSINYRQSLFLISSSNKINNPKLNSLICISLLLCPHKNPIFILLILKKIIELIFYDFILYPSNINTLSFTNLFYYIT